MSAAKAPVASRRGLATARIAAMPPSEADAAPAETPVVAAHVVLTCPGCHLRFAAVVDRHRIATTALHCPYCRQGIIVRLHDER